MPEAGPIAVVLTPTGRGAIATIRVEGPGAVAIVDGLFCPARGRRLSEPPLGQIVFGTWGSTQGEELIVCPRREDCLEIHCHGGVAAVAAVLESLTTAGCRPGTWSEWLARTADDLIEAEALAALTQAPTLRTAAILVDQWHGALRREIAALEAELSEGHAAAAATRLDALEARVPLGRHLVEPFLVVLAGEPNVGKSSLANRLVGYGRSIVFDQPGTTRDVVTADTALAGWPVRLVDTAGLRLAADTLERAGVQRAREAILRADLVLLVCDASRRWSTNDAALAAEFPAALLVHNKCDRAVRDENRPEGCPVSALVGTGLDDLLSAIGSRLVPEAPPAGAAVPFTARQEQWLREVRRRISSHRH